LSLDIGNGLPQDPLKRKTLGLFMTRGLSLGHWADLGILTREAAVYNELARYFGQVRIFTYGGETDLAFSHVFAENVRVVPAGMPIPKLLNAFAMSWKAAKEIRGCDYLKSNQMFGAVAAVFAGAVFGKPVIVRTGYTLSKFLAGEGVKGWKRLLGRAEERLAYGRASLFIVSSRHDSDYVRDRYRLKQERGMVIPNYIDTALFSPEPRPPQRDVLFVGRFTAQKNLGALLDALAGTGLTATFVGKGEKEEALKRQAAASGIDILWPGSIPNADLPELIRAHRIFVLPSHFEGMPKSLLEAMSCGLCVLGTDVDGINEVIDHGRDGWLSATDGASLRACLLRLMGDGELRLELGRNARRKVEESYSLQGLVAREADFYRRLLAADFPIGAAV
jgi:glycosyltransferase involved in cell wall biosynthesis